MTGRTRPASAPAHSARTAAAPAHSARTAAALAPSALAAAAASWALVLAGCSSSGSGAPGGGPAGRTASASSGSFGSYGSLPSFLPTPSITPHSLLTGSERRPALASQGDAVRVVTPTGSVLARVTGPVVPASDDNRNAAAHCTWTVQLEAMHGRVPVRIGDFTVIDELGAVTHPSLVPGDHAPNMLLDGESARFRLRTVTRPGEGLVRWAPGHTLLASWDFVAEVD